MNLKTGGMLRLLAGREEVHVCFSLSPMASAVTSSSAAAKICRLKYKHLLESYLGAQG